ncbi:unnamed protein product [Ectocarpus sp. CCAP 1310/34]|nr:unnamed protein product [Ectocarpus sp. CCAP 1310/34]
MHGASEGALGVRVFQDVPATGKGACDICGSPMVFEKTMRKGKQATLQFHRDEKRTDADDSSRGSDMESGEDSSSSSDGM